MEEDNDFGPLYISDLLPSSRPPAPHILPLRPSPISNLKLKLNVKQEYIIGSRVLDIHDDDRDNNLKFDIEDVVNEMELNLGPVVECLYSDSEDDFNIVLGDADGAEVATGGAARVNGGLGQGVVAPNIGYINPVCYDEPYDPYQSRFQYKEPVVAAMPQVPLTAGCGKFEQQLTRKSYASSLQKSFEPGFEIPFWENSDFRLPSYKTIFEVDVDSFEEKPWKLLDIDLSIFFNYELNEESWKDYRKQLVDLMCYRNLPRELAEAMGHDIPPEKHPTQRAIYVEACSGDRLPSVARPPRVPDFDTIIEIVLQGSEDNDLIPQSNVARQTVYDALKEDFIGMGNEHSRDSPYEKAEHSHGSPLAYSEQHKGFVRERASLANSHQGTLLDGVRSLPILQEGPGQSPQRDGVTPHEERSQKVIVSNLFHNIVDSESTWDKGSLGKQNEDSHGSISQEYGPQLSSRPTLGRAKEPDDGHGGGLNDVLVLVDQSCGLNGEVAFARSTSADTRIDENLLRSAKKIKLCSQVVRSSVQEISKGTDFRTPRNSKDRIARTVRSTDEQGLRSTKDSKAIAVSSGDRPSMRSKSRDVKRKMENHYIFETAVEDFYSRECPQVKMETTDRRSERKSVEARQLHKGKLHGRSRKAEDTRKSAFSDELGLVQEYFKCEEQMKYGKTSGKHNKVLRSLHMERNGNVKVRYESTDDLFHKGMNIEGNLRKGAEEDEIMHDDLDLHKSENDDWYYKLKQSQLKSPLKRGKEGRRGAARGARGGEDVGRSSDTGLKHEFGSDCNHQLKGEQFKRKDLVENECPPTNMKHLYVQKPGNLLRDDKNRSYQERTFTCNDHSTSGPLKGRKQRNSKDRKRNSMSPPRRHQREYTGQMKQLVTAKGSTEHFKYASFEDERENSKRGRSKFERWTGYRDQEFTFSPEPSSCSLNVNCNFMNNDDGFYQSGDKYVDVKPLGDMDIDKVEKKKIQRETFNLSMPSEKEAMVTEKLRSEELPSTEALADSETKFGRPIRKRRWDN